jgi:hypothetical protein
MVYGQRVSTSWPAGQADSERQRLESHADGAKYRNPKHQLDAGGQQAYNLLAANPTLMGVWTRTHMDEQAGTRYFRRITVESACLACHGPKDKRLAFVQHGYPEDRAYDFQAGDLRGIYSLFIPNAK